MVMAAAQADRPHIPAVGSEVVGKRHTG